MKTKIGLITTTINVPHVLELHNRDYPRDCELEIVVAGDVQTPPEARNLVERLSGTYLGVNDDATRRWYSHEAIGERSIQRRNLALLHAITLGCDVIVTIDDDNAPFDVNYLDDFVVGLTTSIESVMSTSNGWYDPGCLLEPRTVHRGFPLSRRHEFPAIELTALNSVGGYVGVVAGLCIGNPDVDAIERIVNRPRATGIVELNPTLEHGVVLAQQTWAPFNTQNTAYAWGVAPLMQCLVGVGRYDDIWMSYVARRIMDEFNCYVRYGVPIAVQDRNVHNLITDLKAELFGYENTDLFTDELRNLGDLRRSSDDSVIDALERAYAGVAELLPTQTNEANAAWLADVRVAVAEGETRRKEMTRD